MAALADDPYPVTFSVEYPDRDLSRVSTAFRILAAIPIVVLLALISGASAAWSSGDETVRTGASGGGILVAAPALMILFRQKYPRWWFDWNLALMRFENRVGVYVALLRDEYPATDDEQAVALEIPYPDAERDLNRWLPLVKWFLAIPHYVMLVLLGVGAIIAVVLAWFAILFSGRYPRTLFDYVVGVMRWFNRVSAYAFLMATDRYPPFRLRE